MFSAIVKKLRQHSLDLWAPEWVPDGGAGDGECPNG